MYFTQIVPYFILTKSVSCSIPTRNQSNLAAMIKLLLKYFFTLSTNKKGAFSKQRKNVLFQLGTLMILLLGSHSHGQQVDSWFNAGKGINSPTSPYWLYQPDPITTLGQDGNSVNTWYDIVYYVEQNLIPNPADPADYPNDPFWESLLVLTIQSPIAEAMPNS